MCNTTIKDQTPREVIDFVKSKNIRIFSESVTGMGIFFVPAPDKGILETRGIVVDNLTYAECIKRGSNCEGFQWIPKSFEFEHPETKARLTFQNADDIVAHMSRPDSCGGYCFPRCSIGCQCTGIFCKTVWL